MAKQCIHCGKTLPRDNARFCNNCGKSVSSSRPPKRSLSNDPPAWISQLENTIDNVEVDLAPEAVELPKPLTGTPPRELHVRVWEQEETVAHSRPEEDRGSIENEQDVVEDLPTEPLSVAGTPGLSRQPLSIPNHTVANVDNEELAEDLPTMPLAVTPPETPPALHNSAPSVVGSSNGSLSHLDEVEKLYTRPHMSQRQWQTTSPPVGKPAKQHKGALPPPIDTRQSPGPQKAVTPIVFPQPQLLPAHGLRQTPPASKAVPPVARPERKSRRGLVIVSILLFILVVGGLSAWIIIFQPFTVPEITNTSQPFQNTDLGVSLDYPQKWTAKFDKKNEAIYFYDDNRTDQVNISAVATGGKSIDQYISTVAGSLGMTGQKAGASLSFAGVSWQQEQGSMLQSGATYTAVLLVTMHGGRYYAILQLAPATTYAQEDQLVFSRMRSSFQFI